MLLRSFLKHHESLKSCFFPGGLLLNVAVSVKASCFRKQAAWRFRIISYSKKTKVKYSKALKSLSIQNLVFQTDSAPKFSVSCFSQ